MKSKMMLDKLAKDLGLKLEKHNPNEFKAKPGEINMPMSTYVNMASVKAIDVHLNNLFITYGTDKVVEHMVNLLKKA